jgi:hypothetical protein
MAIDQEFFVDTHPTKTVVVESLTKDASIVECVLDLIDNAVDAARDTAYESLSEGEPKLLLDDYSSFTVALTFSGTEFTIVDDCKGVDSETLKTSVLRFGQRSHHEMGIGLYGVGLNRAIFKLGRRSEFITDTGTERSEIILDVDAYLENDNWDLPAKRISSKGASGTSLKITKLPTEVSQTFADTEWIDDFFEDVGRRYGAFIDKGLRLSINGIPVPAEVIEIRENSPFQEQYKTYRTEEGVSIHLRCGQHLQHRFNGETGYDEASNRALTAEFGWTVLCNDRAILLADTTSATGWDGKFHSEFYGSVGIVRFVASDPAKLPWNTKKTGVDLNNPAYQAALADMRRFAEAWRSFATRRKKAKAAGKPFQALPPATPLAKPPTAPTRPTSTAAVPAPSKSLPPTLKQDHNSARMVLPEDIDEGKISDKLLALVHEAKDLDMVKHPYSGLALIRMLFETSVSQFLIRRGDAENLQAFVVDGRKKLNPDKQIDANKVIASIDEMIDFLDKTPAVWGTGKQSMLKHSLTRLKGHKPRLNGVLHNPFQAIDRNDAFSMRTEMLPILRHLIEN